MRAFKQIPRFPDYLITKNGKVWSKSRGRNTGRWLKPMRTPYGYLTVCVYNNKLPHCERIHRLVLETYIGPCPPDMECRHLDGNPANNKLNNLKWGTPKENHLDMKLHGTRGKPMLGRTGEKHPSSKLSDVERKEIRNLYSTGLFSQRALGRLYSVRRTTIRRFL